MNGLLRTPWVRDYWRLGEQPSEHEIQIVGRHVDTHVKHVTNVRHIGSLLLLVLGWLLALSAWFEENAVAKLSYSVAGLLCFVFTYVTFHGIRKMRLEGASFPAGDFKVVRGWIGDIYAYDVLPPNEISVLFVPETEELRPIRVCMRFDGHISKGDPAFIAAREVAKGQIDIWPVKL